MDDWASKQLASLLDYMDGTSIAQVLQQVKICRTSDQVATYYHGLLGDTPDALAFISEYNIRRFGNTTGPVPQKVKANAKLTSDLGQKMKKPTTTSISKEAVTVKGLSAVDTALKALEINETKDQKQVSCDCQARRHGLNEVVPNCLACGKIICNLESFVQCSFCHASLISSDQKAMLVNELKRERAAEATQRNNAQQGRKQKIHTKSAYASKVGANFATLESLDADKIEASTDAAEARKNALLEHIATGAKRTIIDEASDFQTASTDKWADPEQRALALRKHLANVKAEQEAEGGGRRVLSIDLGGKGKAKVTTQKQTIRSLDEIDYTIGTEETNLRALKRQREKEQAELDARVTSNGGLTRSSILGALPPLAAPQTKIEGGWYKTSNWRRVQDDDEEGISIPQAVS